jgi:hypothetical protein
MNWEALGAVAELAAAIGVIVSLLYLATQIRQNTRSLRAVALDSSADRFAEELRAVALNPDLAELLEVGHRDYTSLEGTQRRRYRALTLVHFRQYETIFLKYREGLIPPAQWEGFANSLEYANRRPGIQQCWKENRANFGAEFRSLVDESVERLSREQGHAARSTSPGGGEAADA